MSSDRELITLDIYDQQTRDAFQARLADVSLNFEAEAGFAVQIITSSDYMLKAAMSNRTAVVNAVTNLASIGLSLNPARKQAYLVPRKPRHDQPVQVCLDISYMGLVELAVSCGAIVLAQARVVYENDQTFVDNGPGLAPTHVYDPRSSDRGAPACVFVAAKLPSGDWHTEIMSVGEINKIRDRSEAWKSGKSNPWKTDWEEMAKKTVAKRASKWWRGRGNTERLDNAIHHLNTDGGEGLAELAPNVHGPTGFDVSYWVRKAEATKTDAACMSIYLAGIESATAAKDLLGAKEFKRKVVAHRTALKNANTIDA